MNSITNHLGGRTLTGGDHLAVEDLSFDVAEGEIVALVGMTGAGKSTALNIVMGAFPAERGGVSVVFKRPGYQRPSTAVPGQP